MVKVSNGVSMRKARRVQGRMVKVNNRVSVRQSRRVRQSLHLSQKQKLRLRAKHLALSKRDHSAEVPVHETCSELDKYSQFVLEHLREDGVEETLVSQLEEALKRRNFVEPLPATMLRKVFDYTRMGSFSVEVVGLQGTIGNVKAKAETTTEGLADLVHGLTGIPTMQQRLIFKRRVLTPGLTLQQSGLSPLKNVVTLVVSAQLPENPVIPLETLRQRIPSGRVPHKAMDWMECQHLVWPGYPPLQPGWIRVCSLLKGTTYFHNYHTGEATYEYKDVCLEDV